jgi:hypothetical protein
MATTDHEPGRFILPNFQVSANIKQVCSNYRYQYLCLLQHLIRFLPSLNESFRCLPSFHANSNFRFGKRRSPHLESSRSKFWLTDFETPIWHLQLILHLVAFFSPANLPARSFSKSTMSASTHRASTALNTWEGKFGWMAGTTRFYFELVGRLVYLAEALCGIETLAIFAKLLMVSRLTVERWRWINRMKSLKKVLVFRNRSTASERFQLTVGEIFNSNQELGFQDNMMLWATRCSSLRDENATMDWSPGSCRSVRLSVSGIQLNHNFCISPSGKTRS